MTGDRKLTDFRRWTLAVLGLLSAGPERQVEYLRASGVGPDEVLLQFDDVLHVARARVADGSLNDEDYLLLQSVNESVNSVSAGPEEIWTEGALKEAAEWEEVRAASRVAKSGLDQSWSQEAGDY
ncbi:hypothetical protein [Streptomyces sp. PsTaAH-124]|uniref:hypothetical protein n=1 Tax=Streptomyces sp. PsTaAH-124 TaxID=1157638 RepID=UPI000369754E|nr:hypothetical protein [Streptomyces sp. PsTaAH-124]